MLDAFRAGAFASDLGMKIDQQPKHNIPGSLQSIEGVDFLAFNSPNYTISKKPEADWDDIHPKVVEVFKKAFGEIKKTEIIDGPLSKWDSYLPVYIW